MSRRVSLLDFPPFRLECGGEFVRAISGEAGRVCHRRRSASAAASAASTPTTKSLVDSMDPADLKEAIQLLKSNYIKPEALNETELNRATFEGILTRLGRGVVLLADSASGTGRTRGAVFR